MRTPAFSGIRVFYSVFVSRRSCSISPVLRPRMTDIWLTAYICASLDDFDADRNYIGDTSCTIHILKS